MSNKLKKNSFITILKSLWLVWFTKNPYKIKSFKSIYHPVIGGKIDEPESLSGVLKRDEGEMINYTQPYKTYNQEINYRYIAGVPRFISTGIFKASDRFVYSISGGSIIGQSGLVYDAKKRTFIDESAKEWNINLYQSPYVNVLSPPHKNYLKGTVFSFLTIGAENGFYHFLFESVVKAGMYQSMLQQANHILFNGPLTDWKLKWLNKANIDTSKIIWADSLSHYECEQLIFTNRVVTDQQVSNWCIRSLKQIFNIPYMALSAVPKIIWISRKGLNKREIEWEDEILAHFPDVESIDLSQLDVGETIDKLQKATHVIGPHGAGLSNTYICAPGTKVLEIYPEGTVFQPCYHRLSSICQLDHSVLYLDFKDQKNTKAGLSAFISAYTEFIC